MPAGGRRRTLGAEARCSLSLLLLAAVALSPRPPQSEAETVSTCFDFRDDYVECLHHKKEFERLNAIHERKEKLGRLAKQEGMTLNDFLAKHPGGPPASGHH